MFTYPIGLLNAKLDADALAYITASAITEYYIKLAINNYVIGLKSNDLWDDYSAIYPYPGNDELSNKLNLKDPRDLDVAFRQTFSGSPIYANEGIKFNGGHGDTHLIPNSELTLNNTHVGYYFIDNTDLDGLSGCRTGSDILGIQPKVTSNFAKSFMYAANVDGLLTSSTLGNKLGYVIGNRETSTNHKIYFNGLQVASHNLTSGNLPTNEFWVGEFNYSGGVLPDEKQCQLFTIGVSLTPAKIIIANQLAQNLQSDLNRKYSNYNIIYDGDSLTLGNHVGVGDDYPTQLGGLLNSRINYVNTNKAISGQTLAQMEADASTDIDTLFDTLTDSNIVLAWGGVNDLGLDLLLTAEQCYQRLKTYCLNRISANPTIKVYAMTMLPQSSPSYAARTTYEADRQEFNNRVLNDLLPLISGVADIASDSRIGDAGDELDLTYYLSDKIHLNAAGNLVVAGIVNNTIN